MDAKFLILLFCAALLLFFNFILCNPGSAAAETTVPLHHISLEFTLESHTLRATSRIELPAGEPLHLDFPYLEVSMISIDGQPVAATQGGNTLDIPAATESQEILLTYSREITAGTSPYNLISDTGITLLDSWHPVADREMLFELTAQIPAGFAAVSEADAIRTVSDDEKQEIIFDFPHPLLSIDFIAGPYVVTQENFGEGKILAAYIFPEDKDLAADYLAKAQKYLARYMAMLGPYPYKRFSIVENRLPTGFAMPTFTLLGQAVVNLPFIVDTSLGHEVLHSWFGNAIRLSPLEGNWVEGLTTYLADQSFAADEGRGAAYRKEQLIKYQSYVRPDMHLVLRDFNNVTQENVSGQPIRAVGYNKSSMFFHMLRQKVGQDIFTAALRDIYKRFRFKTATWDDLKASFASVSNMDLDDFFRQWLDRNDVPELAVSQPEIVNNEGYPVLHFTLVQKNDQPFTLDMELVITTTTGEIHKTVQISETHASFEIPLESLPLTLTIDPEYNLMRVLSPAELPPTWSQFLGAKNKIAVLSAESGRAEYEALLQALQASDVRILLQDEVSDKELSENSVLFLGTEGRLARSLFAQPVHPAAGFTLDARRNPLNPEQVAVLVTAANAAQVEMAAGKLRHYGKYSYLFFNDGHFQDKHVNPTENGLRVDLLNLPSGIETSKIKPFTDIIAHLSQYQVIYIGESHSNYEDHQLQLEIIRALYQKDPHMAIGMEMFSRPSQAVLDSYLAGEIDEKTFLKKSHYFKTWRFDFRLYRDIINFAKHNNLPVIALNLEQDVVNKIFKQGGPNSLNADEAGLLPLDRKLDEPGYQERIKSAYMMHAGQKQGGNFSGFLQAQALWDETMAATIAGYLQNNPDARMVILAGHGHVDKINAIPPRVARRLPASQVVVVNDSGSPPDAETADFVFFTPPASLDPIPLLGVMLGDTDNGEGVLVTALAPQGKAKAAGIKEKDVILAIDSEPVNDLEDIRIAMLYKEKSDSVVVRLKRSTLLFGDKKLDIVIPLTRQREHPHM